MDYAALNRAKALLRNEEPICPACGSKVDRPKCAFELNPLDCPRHALRDKWLRKVRALAALPANALRELDKRPAEVSARTAMTRTKLSRPAKLALQHGLIYKAQTVLDYGCGKGDDVRLLCKKGIRATGYDPVRRPALWSQWFYSAVLCSYVLSTLPSVKERRKVLREAFKHCLTTLIVGVRTDFDSFKNAVPYRDGFVTKAGTFQRPYRAAEFREFVAKTLKHPVRQLAPGIVVVEKRG